MEYSRLRSQENLPGIATADLLDADVNALGHDLPADALVYDHVQSCRYTGHILVDGTVPFDIHIVPALTLPCRDGSVLTEGTGMRFSVRVSTSRLPRKKFGYFQMPMVWSTTHAIRD